MDERSSGRLVALLTAGPVIGVIEVVLASSFAALIFGDAVSGRLAEGVGQNLGAATLALGIIAWTSGARGNRLLGLRLPHGRRDHRGGVPRHRARGLLLGVFRLGNLVRFVPFPVVGGFLAGTGWLLVKGGLGGRLRDRSDHGEPRRPRRRPSPSCDGSRLTDTLRAVDALLD